MLRNFRASSGSFGLGSAASARTDATAQVANAIEWRIGVMPGSLGQVCGQILGSRRLAPTLADLLRSAKYEEPTGGRTGTAGGIQVTNPGKSVTLGYR